MGFKKGNLPWNKGKAWSDEICKKISLTNKLKGIEPKIKFVGFGTDHPRWKGDNADYSTLHKWVNRYLGRASRCSNNIDHKSPRYHWANISGEYRRNLSDWHELCPACNKTDGVRKHERFLTI